MAPAGNRLKIRNRILYEGLRKLGIAFVGKKIHMPRDSQRKRVYDAEDALLDYMETVGSRRVCDEDAIVRLISRILTHPDILARFPSVKHQDTLEVGFLADPKKFYGVAYPEEWKLEFNRQHKKVRDGCWDRLIIMHELAHLLHYLADPDLSTPFHGPVFTGIYLYLVRKFMGKCWSDRLRNNFDSWKVKYHEIL